MTRESSPPAKNEIDEMICAELTSGNLTEAQRADLERRIADADAFPDDAVPWEQVKASLRARWAR